MAAMRERAGRYLVSGYASLFDSADAAGDVVLPGAFRRSLARRGRAAIPMLWQHDPARPVGRWLELSEDGRGLFVFGRLTAGVTVSDDLALLIAEGAVDGLSIGFRTLRASRDSRRALRLIHEADLWEVSLVTFPMHPQARLVRAAPGGRGGARVDLARRLEEATGALQLSMS